MERCEVAGTGGRFVIEDIFQQVTLYPAGSLEKTSYTNPIFGGMYGFESTFKDRIHKFLEEVTAGVAPEQVGLLVWAPQGNRQDEKVLAAGAAVFGERFARLPLVTTTFNTGYIESASILVSLAATLSALAEGTELWPQRTGVPALDDRPVNPDPEYILALASTDLGYNFAAVLRRGWHA